MAHRANLNGFDIRFNYFVPGNLRYLQNEYVVVTFDKFWVNHFLPPVLALDVSPVRKMVGNEIPTLTVDLDQLLQRLVLEIISSI